MSNVNANNHLAVMLLELRRHINSCAYCKAAIKAVDPEDVCKWTSMQILKIAARWDRNIPGRLAAHKGTEAYFFPCPDVNAHGSAYAVTAEPCVAESLVGRLF